MRNERKAYSLSTVAALFVLAAFALGILSVLLGSTGAYQRLLRRDRQTDDSRSAVQYLATKVRQAPAPGSLQVVPFGEGDAMQIKEKEDGSFVTRIYCHEGWLMELFCAVDSELLPEDGEKVLPMECLVASLDNGCLTLSVTDGTGREQKLLFSLRGEVAG